MIMSRLTEQDIEPIFEGMKKYDSIFKEQTGCTMAGLAMQASGCRERDWRVKTAVCPVTAGLGIISGFSQAIACILKYYGIPAQVTEKTDVSGLMEARQNKNRILFEADDDTYLALDLPDGAYSENGEATGKIFAAALRAAAEKHGRSDEMHSDPVLVLGSGPVGRAAAGYLSLKGFAVDLYDICTQKAADFAKDHPGVRSLEHRPRYSGYSFLLDATPQREFIDADNIRPGAIISAPGVPLGVTPAVKKKALVIHNPLELGTLMMYFECLARGEREAG